MGFEVQTLDLKNGRRDNAHVQGQKVKIKTTRPLNAVTQNHPYFRNREACKSPPHSLFNKL